MRMRRKRHLGERLENLKYLLFVEGDGFWTRPEEERVHRYDWHAVFGNDNPLEVEIGCGKGQFILEKARQNKDVNYLAVEKISNVIVTACERAEAEGIENVRFLNVDAYNLPYYFSAPVARRLYLNFSTPYPNRGNANRRLTNPKYLKIYRDILLGGGVIEQKTDSRELFEYSLETLSQNGFILERVTLDLHNSYYADDNIVTEYEQSFIDRGAPIYALLARRV